MRNITKRPPLWVQLEGVHNMRDLGGYFSAEGPATQIGLIFRSDTLENATTQDIEQIRRLGIRRIIDLRTHEEAVASFGRYRLAHDRDIHYVCLPTIPEGAMASRVFPVGDVDAIGDLYLENVLECRGSWAAALELLAWSDAPTIVHCAAGRDRTGALSALLLAHARVDDEEVALDYTATASRMRLLHEELSRNPLYRESQISDPTDMPVEAQSIYRFLDNVRARFGGVSQFLAELIGPSSARALKARLLGLGVP